MTLSNLKEEEVRREGGGGREEGGERREGGGRRREEKGGRREEGGRWESEVPHSFTLFCQLTSHHFQIDKEGHTFTVDHRYAH